MTKPLKDKEGQSSRRRAASPPPRHHATRSRRKLQPQAEEEVPGPAQNALTQDALPQSALPQVALPRDALPQDALPQDALPQDALPLDALPLDALPLDALPLDALPQDPLPQDPLPQDPLIHQLQTAFTKIGKETVALELQNLTAHSQEILVATIQASLRKIAKDYDKSTTFHIESYASSPRTIPGGLHELEKLYHEEKAKMMADVQNLHQKTKILESKLEAAGKEITAARESENVWFSALLAKSAGDDGVTDARLIQEFGSLEGQIHALGHSDAFARSGKPTRSHVAVPSEDEEFYLAWSAASRHERTLLIRARMFQFIHDRILNHEMFGVATIATASDTERRSFLHMEERLVELERALKARPVAENHIADWRMATIRCIRSCQRDDRLGDDLATTMYSVFEPLILKDVELEEIELLKKDLSQLCRDAVKLRFLMRGSEEHYECVTLEKGLPLSNNTDIAEKYTVWGGKYEEDCSFIRFTIFGALVHRLRHPPGARRALEKAKVVMQSESG